MRRFFCAEAGRGFLKHLFNMRNFQAAFYIFNAAIFLDFLKNFLVNFRGEHHSLRSKFYFSIYEVGLA